MGDSNKLGASDDEEDLEALRQAALQSLKKKNEMLESHNHSRRGVNSPEKRRFNRSMKGMQSKWGRFFGNHPVRGAKNVQFNNSRVRNTNLISIPTIPSEHNSDDKHIIENDSKFNLPQDRYYNKERKEERNEDGTSKFTRYDKSDESDSESEVEEAASSEDDSPGKLKKADSLEALMEELDAEIQGKTIMKGDKPVKDEKPKKKIKKKKRTSSEAISTSDSDIKTGEQKEDKPQSDQIEVVKHTSENVSPTDKKLSNRQEHEPSDNKRRVDGPYSPARKRLRSRSPVHRRGFNRRRRGNFQKFPNRPPPIPFVPPPTQYPPPVIPFPPQPFNPMFCPAPIISQPPPFYERPVSPLTINTESLTTATLAPLSPRSAAFVLENKAIIERRKRRSYSRSPSRSPRRSLTPRRSPRRSITPRRASRSPRRLSRSPRRRSLSPKRRSLSPRRKPVAKTAEGSPKSKAPVRDRLGVKLNKTEENKDKPKEPSPKKEEKPLDPVLEARKRKFESNEIKMKEGIIRLKPKEEKLRENAPLPVPPPSTTPVTPPKEKPVQKEEKAVKKEEKAVKNEEKAVKKEEKAVKKEEKRVKEDKLDQKKEERRSKEEQKKEEEQNKAKVPDEFEELERLLNEDVLLGSDEVDAETKVDIFSDEDSASDNEGRFKVMQQASKKLPVLSFTKLVNGDKREIKPEPLLEPKRRDRKSGRSDRRRSRGRSPNRKDTKENVKEVNKKLPPKKAEVQEKSSRGRVAPKGERHAPAMEKRFERKIEIKIKNPSKYERGGKLKFTKEPEEKTPERVKRKVELGCSKEDEEDVEPEILVENGSGEDENSAVSEGDLRAQLSKKRAEKLQRIPIEGVSSRLLQSALQGAVFKESKKKSKEQDISSSDGKLPVYLRLGIANNSDIFTDTKVKRKSRKRKNREVLEQVYYLLLRHYYASHLKLM